MKAPLLPGPDTQSVELPTFAFEPPGFNLEHTFNSKKFGRVYMRPIRLSDEARMVTFHGALSDESIYFRYFEHISLDARTVRERLAKVCANTADSFALVAEQRASTTHPRRILAVGRLTTTPEDTKAAAFALLVSEQAQESDLADELLQHLLATARAYRFERLTGELLVADHEELNLCRRWGFKLRTIPEDGIVRVTRRL